MPRSVLRTPVFLTALFWTFPVHSTGFSVPNNVSPIPDSKKSIVVANLLRGAIDALEPPSRKDGVEHLTILMVGDTGYAPSQAKPLPKGVYKYGHWQTFEETTRKIRSEINADINFANIETVISARNLRPYPKKYNFITHPNGARHLVRAGF